MGVGDKPTPRTLYPGEETWYLLYGRLSGPQGQSGRLRGRENLLPSSGLEHQAVQYVASLCTDCTIASPSFSAATYLKEEVNSRDTLSWQHTY